MIQKSKPFLPIYAHMPSGKNSVAMGVKGLAPIIAASGIRTRSMALLGGRTAHHKVSLMTPATNQHLKLTTGKVM